MKTITKDQAEFAMEHGDFGGEITAIADKVAVILTQSWCPQWHAMKSFVSEEKEAEVFCLEYDKTDYFDKFRMYKENTLRNDLIPYVRYYRGGKLVAESNAVSQGVFHTNFGK